MEKELQIEKLISIYGSANKTATALNLDRQLVDKWRKQGYIPFKNGVFIENATGGQIKAADIYQDAAIGNQIKKLKAA